MTLDDVDAAAPALFVVGATVSALRAWCRAQHSEHTQTDSGEPLVVSTCPTDDTTAQKMGAEEKVRCTHCVGSHLSLVYSLFDCRLPASWLTGRGDGGGGARTLPLWRGRLQLARARVHLLLTLLPLSCWWMAGLTHLPPVSASVSLECTHSRKHTCCCCCLRAS